MASSIRAAVAWARGHDALLLLVTDQPSVDARHLERLVGAHRRGEPIVASRYDGVLGVPALFARDRWDALASLAGDRGARALLRSGRVAHVALRAGGFDADTPSDLARL